MINRTGNIFLFMVLVQGAHSIEEYLGKLWEVFEPARILTALVSNNLETGFLIINIGLFVFGLTCWVTSVRINHWSAKPIMIFWIILESINGIGHAIWSFSEGGYTAGLLTAPVLFVLALYLGSKLAWSDTNDGITVG